MAAGAAKLAAGLPKSVSCGMGLEPRATAAAQTRGAKRARGRKHRKDAFSCALLFVMLLLLLELLVVAPL